MEYTVSEGRMTIIMFSSLGYNIKQGILQVIRNRGMSLASMFSITAMLLILGLCFTIVVNLNLFTEVVKQDYDQVEVYLKDNVSRDQAEAIMNSIAGYSGVDGVEYRSKEEALEIMKQRWGESAYLLDSLGNNPFPSSILISVKELSAASGVADYAGSIEGVDDVQYYKETVEKLTKITDFLQIACLVIMGFLVIVSIVVVSNTVKLTVFAREKEIYIMKYVGATNWFIRGPFMAEGIIIGLLSALISTFLTSLVYGKIASAINDQVIAIVNSPLISVDYLSMNMLVIFVCLGTAIGAWGSIVSMRRFLDT